MFSFLFSVFFPPPSPLRFVDVSPPSSRPATIAVCLVSALGDSRHLNAEAVRAARLWLHIADRCEMSRGAVCWREKRSAGHELFSN